jgi:lipoyl-dependent peroxiredoxin
MALSADLEKAGFTPDSVRTNATAHLEFVDGAPTITRIELDTTAKVPNIDAKDFQKHAEQAKANCPISRLYKGAEIKLTAKLA